LVYLLVTLVLHDNNNMKTFAFLLVVVVGAAFVTTVAAEDETTIPPVSAADGAKDKAGSPGKVGALDGEHPCFMKLLEGGTEADKWDAYDGKLSTDGAVATEDALTCKKAGEACHIKVIKDGAKWKASQECKVGTVEAEKPCKHEAGVITCITGAKPDAAGSMVKPDDVLTDFKKPAAEGTTAAAAATTTAGPSNPNPPEPDSATASKPAMFIIVFAGLVSFFASWSSKMVSAA